MGLLLGTRRVLLGGPKGLSWLLRDEFNDTRAGGSVNGTPATPGPGTRVVVDTGNNLSVNGGNLLMGGRAGFADPALWYDAITRVAGTPLVIQYNADDKWNRWKIGFDTAQAGDFGADIALFVGGNIYESNSATVIAPYVVSTDYNYAILLRAAGAYHFIKGGIFTNWTLLWIESTINAGTVYPGTVVSTAWNANNINFSFFRVPDETWLPTPLAYDTFTGANGTSLDAHTSDTTGPDSQAVTGRSWTEESGDWDIQTNRANPDGAAIATIDPGGADVLADCTVNGGTAGQPAICLRYADTSNYWFLQADRANNQFELHEYNATVDTVRANAAVVFNDSTDYDLRAVCDGQVIDGFADAANKISYGTAALNETATIHGLYADHTECEFDDFFVMARDAGYSKLDSYIA